MRHTDRAETEERLVPASDVDDDDDGRLFAVPSAAAAAAAARVRLVL